MQEELQTEVAELSKATYQERWSLIAGRLPGRTANDVKNYWNTHFQKKFNNNIGRPLHHQKISNKCSGITKNEIIRPQPRNFSNPEKNVSYRCNNKSMITNAVDKDEGNKEIVVNICEKPRGETTSSSMDDHGVQWWTSLLGNCNEIEEEEAAVTNYEKTPTLLMHEEISPPLNGEGDSMQQGQTDDWDDFSVDIDLWNLLD
ncbi:hypothetical protein HAX54_043166 [Datura stramonium]|uniref:Uncharacterized protein n=1 Tax=Datura stramonium TaxID=4076 RepID=A0ABS8W2W8_DATST|nr:hypothetical protein [Datura stramonium]